MSRRALRAATLVASALAATPTVAAHTLGSAAGPVARFALPPWALWLAGAGVVGLSFLMVAAFLTRPGSPAPHPSTATPATEPSRQARPRTAVERLGQAAFVALFLVAILPALGEGFSASLFPGVFLWFGLWTLLPLAAYVGYDLWARANPFRLVPVLKNEAGRWAYPERLGAWPATVLLLAFIGLEVSEGPWNEGAGLARVLVAYLALTLAGIAAFGREAWLRNGEVFTRLMQTLHAAAPLTHESGRWRARWPWAGLRGLPTSGPGEVAFIVALLYGVNFDGFLATRPGALSLDEAQRALGTEAGYLATLLAGYAVFYGAFLLTTLAIRAKAESLEPARAVASRFAASLIPIAVAYHAAHNLPYLAANAPLALAAVADPLGLWGSATPGPLAFPDGVADALGLGQLVLIVLGHVVAVATAHDLAMRGFASRIQAFRSEIPLTWVMVFYTLVGLWIVGAAATGAGP